MCLIVHRNLSESGRGSNLPNEVIDANQHANPHGFGIAWRTAEGIAHEKFGPESFEDFRARLKSIDKMTGVEYVAHFRTATQGPPCQELSHPFTYEDPEVGTIYVFHNGIIDIRARQDESDTQVFVRDVLAQLPSAWWTNPALSYLVTEAIGWSRLVLMTPTETVRVNESDGKIKGGIWYSTEPLPAWRRVATTGTGVATWATSREPAATTGAIVPWRGTEDAVAAYDRWDAYRHDDDWKAKTPITDDPDLVVTGQTAGDIPYGTWSHNGHIIVPLGFVSAKGDTSGAVKCTVCLTDGEYYRIEGNVFITLDHDDIDLELERMANG